MMYRVKSYVYSGKTPYQSVEILETESLGRSLVLDGKTQSATFDEHIYHEALVHPAMLAHPEPRSVFIGGGGEGATLREALAHPTVERVTMVDLDARVVELSRLHLPTHSRGAFDDSKTTLLHEDARGFLEGTSDKYDVIILDLVDPLEEGTAYTLYTREFYQTALGRLNPGGALVTQSGPGSPLNHKECFTAIVHTLVGAGGEGASLFDLRGVVRDAVDVHDGAGGRGREGFDGAVGGGWVDSGAVWTEVDASTTGRRTGTCSRCRAICERG